MFTRYRTFFPALAVAVSLASLASPAQAYIGPGAGLGAVAVTMALGLGVILLVVGLVWYPLKRTLKKRGLDSKAKKNTPT